MLCAAANTVTVVVIMIMPSTALIVFTVGLIFEEKIVAAVLSNSGHKG